MTDHEGPGAPVGWLRAVVFDAEDPDRLARFWGAVLGVGVVESAPDWIQLAPDRGGAFVAIEPLDAVSTGGSNGSSRTRPDLEVTDKLRWVLGRVVVVVAQGLGAGGVAAVLTFAPSR